MTEEFHYYHTLRDFLDLCTEHGVDKVIDDLGEICKSNETLDKLLPLTD